MEIKDIEEDIKYLKEQIEYDKKHRIVTIYDEKPLLRDRIENVILNYIRQKQINEKNQKINEELREKVKKLKKENKLQKENYKNLILDVSKIAIELGLEEDGTIDEIYAKIKEKDKQIDLMIEEYEYNARINFKNFCEDELRKDSCIQDCKTCAKQHFEKLAKEKGK